MVTLSEQSITRGVAKGMHIGLLGILVLVEFKHNNNYHARHYLFWKFMRECRTHHISVKMRRTS